jgi:hypothetical protein
MVVDDFDKRRSSFSPHKTDAPLVVDSDRVLTASVGSQRLKTIAWRHAQVAKNACLIQKTKLSEGYRLNVRRQFSTSPAGSDHFRFRIGKALNHDETITRRVIVINTRAGVRVTRNLTSLNAEGFPWKGTAG